MLEQDADVVNDAPILQLFNALPSIDGMDMDADLIVVLVVGLQNAHGNYLASMHM
jgi:hypothetical protein